MNLSILLEMHIAVQIHAISAIIAVVLGAYILFVKKGNRAHVFLGRIWFFIMIIVIVSSAFISEIRLWGPFSPIHILTVLGTWGLVEGMYHIRKGNVTAHKAAMKNLYFWGLGAAGTFAFLPGRLMNVMFFPGVPEVGFYSILAIFLIALGLRSHMGKGFISRFRRKNFDRP